MMMIKQLCSFYAAMAICVAPMAYGENVGNPRPGSPHDTLNFHLKKTASGVVGCSGGGHAAFVSA